MEIEPARIYINGLLEPLQSEYDKKIPQSHPYKMMPINEASIPYHVNIDGIDDLNFNNNKFNIFAKVDLFSNRISSGNITDLFSLLYYEFNENVTTYTHYSTIKTLNFCPNKLGLLDLKESYSPLALQNIPESLYINIYQKNYRLLTILSN